MWLDGRLVLTSCPSPPVCCERACIGQLRGGGGEERERERARERVKAREREGGGGEGGGREVITLGLWGRTVTRGVISLLSGALQRLAALKT
jgi:hypothetical protein